MPRAAFTSWRCSECGTVRVTAPLREAFCTKDGCANQYGDLVVYEPRSRTLDPRLNFPELSDHERMIDRVMRTNAGTVGL
jgi:hypothetical protein